MPTNVLYILFLSSPSPLYLEVKETNLIISAFRIINVISSPICVILTGASLVRGWMFSKKLKNETGK